MSDAAVATSPATKAAITIKAVLIDISGTLHVGQDVVPGAVDACRKLFRRGLKVLFLTNTSKMSSVALLNHLREIGFDKSAVPSNDAVMTSVSATRQFLLQNDLRPLCLVEDDLIECDLKGVDTQDPNCVLVGLAPSKFNYERLNEAFRLLSKLKGGQGDSKITPPFLVAIHRSTYYRDSDGGLSLGPGGFVSLLEETSGTTAHVVGKPSCEFYRAALASLEVGDPSNAIMVGDDVVGDVRGAIDAGLGSAILVKTGKYVIGDELDPKTGSVIPTLTVNSIVEAADYICSTLE